MNKLLAAFITAIIAIQLPMLAQAHHSANRFDFTNRDAKVTGIVKKFVVRNPHTTIVLEITDDKGTHEVEFEGHSRNNYYRSGWRAGLVKIGDKVTLEIAPMRDGSEGGYARAVIAADGTKF